MATEEKNVITPEVGKRYRYSAVKSQDDNGVSYYDPVGINIVSKDDQGNLHFKSDNGIEGTLSPDDKGLIVADDNGGQQDQDAEGVLDLNQNPYLALSDVEYTEAPTVQQSMSDSDWLGSFTPKTQQQIDKEIRQQKAIDSLNAVNQAIQVLGRWHNTSLGAGSAQPMATDSYSKYMDRVYQQGQRYETNQQAREKMMNAGKKLQMDWQYKQQKAKLDALRAQAYAERQSALNRKDDAAAKLADKKLSQIDAAIQALRDKTKAEIQHYQTMDVNDTARTQSQVAHNTNMDTNNDKRTKSQVNRNNAVATYYGSATPDDGTATEGKKEKISY